MDTWMYELTDAWVYGRWMDNGRLGRWMNGWIHTWMYGCMDVWKEICVVGLYLPMAHLLAGHILIIGLNSAPVI